MTRVGQADRGHDAARGRNQHQFAVGLLRQRLAAEVRRRDRPPDQHQDDAQQQHADAQRKHPADLAAVLGEAGQRHRGVAVVGVDVLACTRTRTAPAAGCRRSAGRSGATPTGRTSAARSGRTRSRRSPSARSRRRSSAPGSRSSRSARCRWPWSAPRRTRPTRCPSPRSTRSGSGTWGGSSRRSWVPRLNAAIESVVRAVGRMVVSVDAIELVMTMNSSSLVSRAPGRCRCRRCCVPSTLSTSSELAGLARPTPWLPAPAHACAPTVTMT